MYYTECEYNRFIGHFVESIDGLNHFINSVNNSITANIESINEEFQLYPLFLIAYSYKIKDYDQLKLWEIDLNDENLTIINKISHFFKEKCNLIIDDEGYYEYNPYTPIGARLDSEITTSEKNTNHKNILCQSTFVNAVMSFELLISRLVFLRMERHPESIKLYEKKVSLNDVMKYKSIQDLQNNVLDEERQRVMRGNYSSWLDYFKDCYKMDLKYIKPYHSKMIEIFQRRNLLVHNGGKVNASYINNVNKEFLVDVNIDDELEINSEYLRESLDIIMKTGILISSYVWIREKKSNWNKRSKYLIDEIGIDLFMNSDHWDFSSQFFKFLEEDKHCDNATKLIFKINYWISMKANNKFDEIKDELNNFDVGDKKVGYRLCCEILKDNHDRAFEILDSAYPHEISDDELEDWPIFMFIKNHPKFEKYLISEKISSDISIYEKQLSKLTNELFN